MGRMESIPKLFQVSLRTILEATAFVAFILTLMYLRVENKNGRFQTCVTTSPNMGNVVYVTDSVSGQVWMSNGSGWARFSPVPTP